MLEFGNVDEAFDVRFQLDKRTEVGRLGHLRLDHRAGEILVGNHRPRVGTQLPHPQAHFLLLLIDAQDFDFDPLAFLEDFLRVIDPAPAQFAHVQQAIHTADIDKRTVVLDRLDHARMRLANREVAPGLRFEFLPLHVQK